jgi:transcriptional regulator with XRE-family HTH domain
MKEKEYNTIREAIEKAGKSQPDIVAHFGLNSNTVSRWCNNRQQPNIAMFFDLSEHLGLPLWDLIKSESSPVHVDEINELKSKLDSVINELNEVKTKLTAIEKS